jgi:hypothetical protein
MNGSPGKTLDILIRKLRRENSNAYLVVDAVWQTDLARSVRATASGWEPLIGAFGERRVEAHWHSPLIVDLEIHSEVVDYWLKRALDSKLGIVVFSRLPIEGIRTSLKRFTTVLTPASKSLAYLRFYDARTLYCFLRSGFAEQWQDFFRDITLIAASTDDSSLWTLFQLSEGVLHIGRQGADGMVFHWYRTDESTSRDPDYQAAMPFRRIAHQQYDLILKCARRGFHKEMHNFLVKAFAQETTEIGGRSEILELIQRAHSNAEISGYGTEDCVFRWVVLSFMCGENFYLLSDVERFLQIKYLSNVGKLSRLLSGVNNISYQNADVELLTSPYRIAGKEPN